MVEATLGKNDTSYRINPSEIQCKNQLLLIFLIIHSLTQVLYIEWHPSASDVLLSAGGDHAIFVWNTKTCEAVSTIRVHEQPIQSLSWNYDGSYFATSCRDKKIRIINPHTGEMISVSELQKCKERG